MKKLDLLFLHGFMGHPSDGDFLKTLGHHHHALPIPHSAPHELDDLFANILQIQPDIIYGYSLGGRVLLNFLARYEYRPKLIILESVHFGLNDETMRRERKELDRKRAHHLKEDLRDFLDQWYAMPIWGELSKEAKDIKVTNRYDRWAGREQNLAETIEFFSPGSFPPVESSLITSPCLYLYGEDDQKYKEYAQSLKAFIVQGFGQVGHCIHQSPQQAYLLSYLKKEISLL